MGVDLGAIIPVEPVTLEGLRGRAVAIDGNNAMYQFAAAIRGPDGTPLKDARGRVTSHLSGYLNRMASLVENGVFPIVVWDGKPPQLKSATIQERRKRRDAAAAKYEEALKAGDKERARMLAMQATRIGRHEIEETDRLLHMLGVPTVQAPAEGEAQASLMAQEGTAFAAASQDYDTILFGAPRLVRNLTLSGRRKLPGRDAFVDIEPELVTADTALKAMGLDRQRLVWAAMLVGTDFNEGIKGIGPKRGLAMAKEQSNLRTICDKTGLAHDLARAVEDLFLHPDVQPGIKVDWPEVDEEAAVQLLVAEHQFGEERVRTAVGRIKQGRAKGRQKTLGDWF